MPSSTDNTGQQSSSKKADNRLNQDQKDKLQKAPGITPRNNESRQSKGGSKTAPGWTEPKYNKWWVEHMLRAWEGADSVEQQAEVRSVLVELEDS